MKSLLSLALGTLLLAAAANAAESGNSVVKGEQSPDIVKPQSNLLQQRAPVSAVMSDASIAAVTPEQVGDADSFGRKVKYLGLVMTRGVTLQADCTGFDTSFGDRCVPLGPEFTSFGEADLGRIELPAKAAHSLLCFDLTNVGEVRFENPTAIPRTAGLTATATVVVESPVLNDPGLRDPITGLPYGGQLFTSLNMTNESHTIAAGAFELTSMVGPTRSCIGGLLTKQSLMSRFGLTEKQAERFFKSPITLRFGSSGQAISVSWLSVSYGIRLYGD